ncbi:MAG: iron complex outermembrane receptor protein, partial [bacterium]
MNSVVSIGQYSISGYVTDEKGSALELVDVFLHETHVGTSTDINGYFEISDVKKGHYHLHVTLSGYHAQQRDIDVTASVKNLNFFLEASINELHEVIIENSLEKQDLKNNPLQVVHLDAHFLKQQGGTSLMKSLEKIPGIGSLNTSVGVSKPSLRGLNGNRVVVTTDGIQQEGQQWGSDHGLEVDVSNADKIEVIKGASALVYGSDAIAGVINIRPTLPKGKNQFSAGQELTYNSLNNELRSSSVLAFNKNGRWFKARYSSMTASDFRVPSDQFIFQTTVLPIYEGRLKNTALNEKALNIYAGVSQNWGYWYLRLSHFRQQSGFFSGAFGIPSVGKLQHDGDYSDIDLPYQEVEHTTVSGHANILINSNWLEIDAGYQFNNRSEIASPHNAAFGDGQRTSAEALRLKLSTITCNARYFINDSNSKKIIGFSGQLRSNDVGGYEFIIPGYQTAMAAVYGLYKTETKNQWKVNFGGRLDMNFINFGATQTSFYQNGQLIGDADRNPSYQNTIPNWAMALGLNKEVQKSLFVKWNSAKTSRMIQPNELASNGLHHGAFRFEKGDINLKPETAIQNDFSLIYERKRWLIESSVYGNYFFNFVYLNPSNKFARLEVEGTTYPYPEAGQLFSYTQAPVRHYGYEVHAEYKAHSAVTLYANSEYT